MQSKNFKIVSTITVDRNRLKTETMEQIQDALQRQYPQYVVKMCPGRELQAVLLAKNTTK